MVQTSDFIACFILALFSLQIQCAAFNTRSRGFCGTSAPGESLRAEHKRLSSVESGNDATHEHESRKVVTPIEIMTWFHIVSSEADSDLVSDEMIITQLSYLQKAYQNATITYRLEGITRQVNELWSRNGDEMAMKSALRRGNYSTLNIYFQSDLQANPNGAARHFDIRDRETVDSGQLSSSVLGFCTLPDPSINSTSPRASYVKDGCNVLAQTMPGGPLSHYNRGGTTIHEIGHWNGLLHTFEGESCSPDNDGDYISDTPQQSEPTDGCPSQKDSCPDRPGLDPIHNFMDYSSDECYESFTPGQVNRMRNLWFSTRQAK